MHEGIFSLMQMGKVSAALARYHEAGGLFISVLTNPTMVVSPRALPRSAIYPRRAKSPDRLCRPAGREVDREAGPAAQLPDQRIPSGTRLCRPHRPAPGTPDGDLPPHRLLRPVGPAPAGRAALGDQPVHSIGERGSVIGQNTSPSIPVRRRLLLCQGEQKVSKKERSCEPFVTTLFVSFLGFCSIIRMKEPLWSVQAVGLAPIHDCPDCRGTGVFACAESNRGIVNIAMGFFYVS